MKEGAQERLVTAEYVDLLMKLLQTNTVSPMETGEPSELAAAMDLYARFAAERLNGEVVYYKAPQPEEIDSFYMPVSVQECADRMGPSFWESQPSMVIRLGPKRPMTHTLMFNFHMDTVAGSFPVSFDGERFIGRGAVDMKGPAVALLAGLEGAINEHPALTDNLSILIQCVSGEEGGAMGVYGTKLLADHGYIGSLNLFAEPSAGVYFDKSTTSMTARIEVLGIDATDDAPHLGHNATLLLGYLAQRLLTELSPTITEEGGKMCLAGLHTGTMHNKVYGTGRMLINFAYTSTESGQRIRTMTEQAFALLLDQFAEQYQDNPFSRLTAEAASDICKLTWLKQGLPVLNNRSEAWEGFLAGLGWQRNPEKLEDNAFTCDAMWAQREDTYTIVFGPGSLSANLAHAEGEFITITEMEQYASEIMKLLIACGAGHPKLALLGRKGETVT
ncbi:M20/M25/M40 family metallo-hydrolase [Paenibacillus xylaniclasticus]|uniref:M20/M25/M40 family metallo-hydrolase n=1 Tax=Paenibacillus xylaniclasticus TaxID=588083 RepID=UPI000FD9B694|nr:MULTISPECIES: M20/M25/M40 family metallo-hydrolase [Paenibacillus]GFN32275.1 hypothetical protein PCURB6_25350 [Paenibacillus curdlanolyticus]